MKLGLKTTFKGMRDLDGPIIQTKSSTIQIFEIAIFPSYEEYLKSRQEASYTCKLKVDIDARIPLYTWFRVKLEI